MNYKEAIEKRQSTRNFSSKAVSDEIVRDLQEFFNQSTRLTEDEISLMTFRDSDCAKKLEGIAGYKGFALNASMYMLIMGKKSEESLMSAGFSAMNLILKMTNLGLDTCFIDSEKNDQIKKALGIENDSDILTMIAVGYKENSKDENRIDIKNITHVNVVKRKGYTAPKISQDDMVYFEKWGLSFAENAGYKDPILDKAFYAATLSPYFMNRQNYRYIVRENKIILCDMDDELVSSQDRLIGLGCTMFNFFIVCSEYNKNVKNWKIEETADLDLPEGYKSYASFNI